jgi:protein SCO1/2
MDQLLNRFASRHAFSPAGRSGMSVLLFSSIVLVLFARGTSAADTPAILRDVGFDQRLGAQVPLDLEFADETGKIVRLGDYFGKKPVVLVLAYFRCPMLCTLVLNGTVDAMREMSLTPGKDYEVVTVSFDPRETPELAAAKKKNYVAQFGRPGATEGWHFLTGQAEAIRRLTAAVGFRYVYDRAKDQYIHTSGIVLLTPAGKTARYFFGIRYPASDLRLSLVEASGGIVGSATDEVLLYCFHYDPSLGKYTASVLNFVRAGGGLTMLGLVGLVWFLLKRRPQRGSGVVDLEDNAPQLESSKV